VVPGRFNPKLRVWVAVDTSCSMGTAEITRALSEVAAILRAAHGPVTFLACDASVRAVAKVRTWAEAAKQVVGGGGTDFRPIFAEVADAKTHDRPNLLVIVTDGIGPAPAAPPPGVDVLWVLVGRYAQPAATWGTSIRVPVA
jgi:predicted metal-dependent peptidase